MDKDILLKRLSDIEWDDFEVKRASDELPKDVWETVSAFSNTSGGWLVLGVSQNGKAFEITGVSNPEKIEQDFVTTLRSRNKFNVLINPECKKYTIDGITVLAFYIPSAEIKPIYFNSLHNTFIRTASGDQRATDYEINTLLREQSFGIMSAKSAEGTSVKSFNKASYINFRNYLKRMTPELFYNTLDDDDFNRKLQLVKDEKLTYGGLLFLGDNVVIQDHFPDFRIDYLEIPATSYADAEPRYTYRIQEQENLWEYYFVLFQRLRIYADNPLYIGDMGIGYEDNQQLDALREGLINMIIHCDYFSPMKPRIRVFTNRIEFENPGALPRPIKELMKEDVSIPRNPVLAKLFRIAKLCENAGYGFDKMLIWKKETHKDVLFETSIDKTKVTFMLKDGKLDISGGEITIEKQQENNKKTVEKQQENNKKTARKQQENSKKTARKQPENSKKTTRKQQENSKKTTRKQPENNQKTELIFNLLSSNPAISTSELAKQVGISYGSLRHHLEKMKSENLIKREGADKGGKWIIIK
jgi:predicted HTH transcriptional regulator